MAILMQPFKRTLTAMALLGLSAPVLAQTTVSDAWIRASVPQQQSTGAFMVLTADTDSKLVGVASPAAKMVQIHEMTMNGEIMGMREVKSLDLPAGKPVHLDPEGYHVMLMGLAQQAKEGDEVPLTLTIESAKGEIQTLDIKAPVRPLNAETGGHGSAHTH